MGVKRSVRAPLHLHPHDFLVRRNNFIAHLHQHVEFEAGTLHRENRGMQILAIARQKLLDALIGVVAGAFHLIDRALKNIAEVAASRSGSSAADINWPYWLNAGR